MERGDRRKRWAKDTGSPYAERAPWPRRPPGPTPPIPPPPASVSPAAPPSPPLPAPGRAGSRRRGRRCCPALGVGQGQIQQRNIRVNIRVNIQVRSQRQIQQRSTTRYPSQCPSQYSVRGGSGADPTTVEEVTDAAVISAGQRAQASGSRYAD